MICLTCLLSPSKTTFLCTLLRPQFQISSENRKEAPSGFFFPYQLTVANQVAILDYSLIFEFPFHARCFVSCRFYRTVRTYLPALPISSFRTLRDCSFSCSVFHSLLSHSHRPQLWLKSPCELGNSAPWCIYFREKSPLFPESVGF